jgi:hypothetical protein
VTAFFFEALKHVKQTIKMKKNFTLLAFAALGFAALTVTGCEPKPTPEPEPVPVSSVSLDVTSKTLEIGESVTLTATVLPENAENKSITWSVAPAGVVSVADGVVTALAEGTATVTATAADGSGKSASCTVTVNPKPIESNISIVGDGFDFDQPLEVKYTEATTTPVKVDITSARGIDKLLISIASDNMAFAGALQAVGLATEFDLANPDEALVAKLAGLSLPYGEDVKGKTELSFDITPFIPLMFATTQQAGGGDFGASFTIKVADDKDVQGEVTLNLSLIDDSKVSIAGAGFDITQTQTISPAEIAGVNMAIEIAATRGIDSLKVEITSTNPMIGRMLGAVGLGGEFDVANPSAALTGALAGLGEKAPPTGDAVKGKTELSFNLSGFIPMLYALAGSDCTLSFKLTAKDPLGLSATQTLVVDIVTPTDAL